MSVSIRRLALTLVLFVSILETRGAEISDVRILTFNVWTGEGSRAGQEKIEEIIRASGADIVGLQEMGHAQGIRVAESLGFHYLQQSASDTQFISRFPILERTRLRWGSEIELTPGHSIWLFNAHLAAYPYQPYDLRDRQITDNEEAVIAAANSARGAQVTRMLRDMENSGALSSGDPVFITGDFNEPSHLDWTTEAADFTERTYDFKVDYPTSTRIMELGFSDSFRKVRPLKNAAGEFDFAYTWTPGYPPPRVTRNEVHDRIDIIYHREGSSTNVVATEALTVGPTADRDADSSMTDIAVPRFNADHRGVVVAFDFQGLRGSSLTFSKLGTNGDTLAADYGDNLITTPDVQVDFSSNRGSWKFWEENNWDQGGVAVLDSHTEDQAPGDAVFELALNSEDYTQVSLGSFDLLDWSDLDGVGHQVRWQILRQDEILREGVVDVPDSEGQLVSTGMTDPISDALTLRLTHLSGVHNKLAIDNVAFDQFLLGDFNHNGERDASDIDALSRQLRTANNDQQFDLNGDGAVNQMDRSFWVETLANTFFGDANLDGEFNTADFVSVFVNGQYEDEVPGNSGWSDGDWNGDGDFDSRDLVVVFQANGIEQGPRLGHEVPEPNGVGLLLLGCLLCCRRIRNQFDCFGLP